MNTPWLRTAFLLSLLALSSQAWGQDLANPEHKFRVYLGGFWPQIDSKIGINGEDFDPRPPVNVEDVLRVPDSKGAAWGGINWKISKRNSLEFEYFALNRNGGLTDTFSPPLEVRDLYIESGEIGTFYDTSITRLTYGYSLKSSERMDLQLKAGIHVAKLQAGLRISGQICSPDTAPAVPPGCPTAQTGTASEGVTAPLPHFGASLTYALSETWGMRLTAIGFALEIDSIKGSIVELGADVAWKPWKQFGLGAGMRYFDTSIKAANSTLNGEFDFQYIGPSVFVNYWF